MTSVGNDFNRPNDDDLRLSRPLSSEVIKTMYEKNRSSQEKHQTETVTDAQVEAAAKANYENAPIIKAPETPRRTWEETPHRYRKSWLRMARRGLEAAERAAWQPIDTAPRDGTEVLWRSDNDGRRLYGVIRWPTYNECFSEGEWRPLEDER